MCYGVRKKLSCVCVQLPPAPPPPPFPEGYTPPQTSDAEKGSEALQSSDSQNPRDPVIDEGPSKRPRLEK